MDLAVYGNGSLNVFFLLEGMGRYNNGWKY